MVLEKSMDSALQNSVWVSSPEYAGWLVKRGFHWRKLWKRRWVALHGAELVYMDKEPTLENGNSLNMTKVVINSSTAVEERDIDGNNLGFMVHINDGKSPVWCLRAESHVDKKNWLTRLNHLIAIVRWLEEYEKVRVLGVGGTGIVYELLHKADERKFAMKEMEIKSKSQMQMALQEAEMLKDIMEKVSHPNIMHIDKVFQVGSKFYLVFPLCTGGELYEHIIRRGNFTETDAALLTRDLISGIKSLHDEDILHLDIKPENILFDSKSPDAKIKITDFGLSRVLGTESGGSASNTPPTEEDMQQRIVQLFERGIFKRDQLRGTIGYMSPELILTGYCSKAADIFAAGVVLYILLCGHPPFHSKSNREVLERTSRGQYTMKGPQWNDVSSEAKDLVEKMLTPLPSKRISAKEVLDHPWLKNLPIDSISEAPVVDAKSPSAAFSTKKASLKGTGASLSGLRLLSGHVADRNAEKLASSLTRLVTSLQIEEGASNLIRHVLQASNEDAQQVRVDEDMMILQNPDLRSSLSSLLGKVSQDGKISCDAFLVVMKHFGIAQNFQSNVPGVFFCRFIDQDGDGFISADDIFTSQALIIQRSEVFLRALFRIYSEAVWYPGRNLNIANYHRSPRKGGGEVGDEHDSKVRSSSCKVLSDSVNESLDIVEPPKFITARHVAEIFSKIGLQPTSGQEVFNALCIALTKQKKKIFDSSDSLSDKISNTTSPVRVEGGDRCDSLDGMRASVSQLKNSESAGDEDNDEGDAEESFEQSPMPSFDTNLTGHPSNLSSSSISSSPVPRSVHKMDVQDFITASAIDDVLVQALLFKPRKRIFDLLKSIVDLPIESREASTLEQELVKALDQAELDAQPTLAKSMGQATFNVAVDVASKVAGVSKNFFGAISEAAEADGETISTKGSTSATSEAS